MKGIAGTGSLAVPLAIKSVKLLFILHKGGNCEWSDSLFGCSLYLHLFLIPIDHHAQ